MCTLESKGVCRRGRSGVSEVVDPSRRTRAHSLMNTPSFEAGNGVRIWIRNKETCFLRSKGTGSGSRGYEVGPLVVWRRKEYWIWDKLGHRI